MNRPGFPGDSRIVAYKDGTSIRLMSRAGNDHSRRFAELAAAIRALPPATLILDGEVAIFDDRLISRFECFRKRPEDVISTPPIYMAFDCLHLEGQDLRQRSLRERRAELAAAVENDIVPLFPARRLAAKWTEQRPERPHRNPRSAKSRRRRYSPGHYERRETRAARVQAQ